MINLPEGAVMIETVTVVKYFDEFGDIQTENFYGQTAGDGEVDFGEVLKLFEAGRYVVYRELMLEELREDLLDDLREEFRAELGLDDD